MRKKSIFAVTRLMSALILGVGLCLLGTTYATWTTGLNIRSNLRTGVFNIIFPDSCEENYYACLTDENDNLIEDLEVVLSVSKDGKQLNLTFCSGLPLEQLEQGDFIKIVYPLKEAENNTISEIELVEPALFDEGEKVQMKAISGILMVDGTPYGMEKMLKPFMIPLKFYTYAGIMRQKGTLKGYLYLKLTEESMMDLEYMPEVIELDAEDMVGESDDKKVNHRELTNITDNGVVIAYSGEIPVYLNQSGAKKMDNK